MKSVTLLLKSILPLLLVLVTAQASWAQFPYPVCSGNGAGKVYIADQTTSEIQILDPSKPFNANPAAGPLNPIGTGITLPTGAVSLAVGTNYGTGPNPTYFTTALIGASKFLHYWNGSGWTNTTVQVPLNADHITGSCGAIYLLDCPNAFVYRWAGAPATNAPLLVPGIGGINSCDIAGDCGGNFWVINQTGVPATLRKYNVSGSLIGTYNLTGTFAGGAGGLAINGNFVYYDGADGNLYTGIINNATSTVNFSRSTTSAPFTTNPVSDFASCGYEAFCLGRGDLDSIGYCGDTARITLRATGPGPYNFTVISGPATLNVTGNQALVTATGPSLVTYMDADCNGANTIMDTTVVFVTKGVIDAGPDTIHLIGCRGYFLDTLDARLVDSTIGVNYTPDWTPLGTIISGNTTWQPIVNPVTSITYYLEVKTQNGCTWHDSVRIQVADSTPKANFTWVSNLGCLEDTIRFINTTPTDVYVSDVLWNFEDTVGNNGQPITSTEISPVHIFKKQGIYSVLLTMSNQYCLDTFRQFVNTLHPLVADFSVDDSACAHEIIAFTDKSTFTSVPSFLYKFGDGDSSLLSSPTHKYMNAGSYSVRLSLMDGLGCTDTVFKTIFIDTIPYVRFISPDSLICEGEAVRLYADFLGIGNTGSTIDMGDGTVFQNSDTTIYSYNEPKDFYDVVLTAHYRACADTSIHLQVTVNPFPGVNIGPDTVLCPNGTPIVLSDRNNVNNPEAKYLWSTGDTTASIKAKDIGNFWARVTLDGCTGTDSLMINKDCYINIPNAFTPDGDGNNDYFLPRQFLSRSLTSFKMSIFNRWGEVVYESSTINGRGWDGKFNDKEQPQGVYVYLIDVAFDNGVSEHYTGNLTLLR